MNLQQLGSSFHVIAGGGRDQIEIQKAQTSFNLSLDLPPPSVSLDMSCSASVYIAYS